MTFAGYSFSLLCITIGVIHLVRSEYTTAYERVYLGGMISSDGDSQYGSMFYPIGVDASTSLPFISFAHGMLAGGTKLGLLYNSLLSSVAGAGYIVVGTESCIWSYCPLFYEDVLQTIDDCKENGTTMNPIFKQANFSSVGILGHSMGGGMTEICCQKRYTEKYSIRAGFALNPALCITCERFIDVPIFYGAGTNDSIVPDDYIEGVYNTTPPPKAYADMVNCTHFEPNLPDNRWIPVIIQWFDCYLKGDSAACSAIYNTSSPNYFCNSDEFAECLSEG